MTPEEKPFDTSRIPVFYTDGSVKVGDKEYAPGEYPLGTYTTMTDVDTRILELIAGVELGAYRGANDERVEMSQADYKEAAQLIEALAALGDPVVVAKALPELVDAATALSSEADDMLNCHANCGDPDKECPMQDAFKQDGLDDRMRRVVSALAKLKARP